MQRYEVAQVSRYWRPCLPLPHSVQWWALSPANGRKLGDPVLSLAGGGHIFVGFFELDDGQSVWHYVHNSCRFCAVIRTAGQVVLTVSVAPLLNGKDKVKATTINGNVVFEKQYGLFEECRALEFRKLCKKAMLTVDKATDQTKVSMVIGTKILRGSSVIKKGIRKTKFLRWRPPPNNTFIWEFFKPKAMQRAYKRHTHTPMHRALQERWRPHPRVCSHSSVC